MKIPKRLLLRLSQPKVEGRLSRRAFLKDVGLVTAGAGLVWAGCHQVGGVPQDSEAYTPSRDGGQDVNQNDDARPLIDQNAPINTQVATFALG